MIHIQRSVSLPSLKLADTTGIILYFVNLREIYIHFNCRNVLHLQENLM